MTRSLEQEGNRQRQDRDGMIRRFDHIDREIRKLWAGVNNKDRGPLIDMPFSWSGQPAGVLGDLSAPWAVPNGGVTIKFLLTAGTAPTSGTLTVGIYKNGVQFTTVSLDVGEQRSPKMFEENFDADYDLMQVAFTSFGVGAKDITLQARVRTRR